MLETAASHAPTDRIGLITSFCLPDGFDRKTCTFWETSIWLEISDACFEVPMDDPGARVRRLKALKVAFEKERSACLNTGESRALYLRNAAASIAIRLLLQAEQG